MFTAWVGGLRAGVLAAVLSLLSFKYYFVTPFPFFGAGFNRDTASGRLYAGCWFRSGDHRRTKAVGRKAPQNRTRSPNHIEDLNRTQQELHKAQAELAHMTRLTTMGELTASIAHEVNQPLTAVVNNANACISLLDSCAASPRRRRTERRFPTLKISERRSGKFVTMPSARVPLFVRVRQLAKRTPVEKSLLDFEGCRQGCPGSCSFMSRLRVVSPSAPTCPGIAPDPG